MLADEIVVVPFGKTVYIAGFEYKIVNTRMSFMMDVKLEVESWREALQKHFGDKLSPADWHTAAQKFEEDISAKIVGNSLKIICTQEEFFAGYMVTHDNPICVMKS